MKQENDIDMAAETGDTAAPVKNPKAPAAKKAKAKAKPKAKAPAAKKEPTAKQLQAAATKAAAAEEKAAAKKIADAEKAAEAKAKTEQKLTVTAENACKPLINAGLKAMHMVGNGNKGWTIAAHKIRVACKGTQVNFKDVMAEGWGVAPNTATKLANAGQLMFEITESENEEVRNQLAYMPMGSINNLSTISGFSEKKLDKGIDLEVIRMDATEAAIADFNRDYNDKGAKIVVKDVPSTPAADAEDDADPATGVSDSETPAELQARILLMTASMSEADAISLIEAIEVQHKLVAAE